MDATVGLVMCVKAGPADPEAWTTPPLSPGGLFATISSPPASLTEVAQTSSVIVLALPENELRTALTTLNGGLSAGQALVSTCPTVPLRLMRSLAGAGPALFRAILPPGNGPGEGVAALAAEPGAEDGLVAGVRAGLAPVGLIEMVTEEALDAAFALALGGPSYLCAALEGMEEAAVAEGLPRSVARAFVHQTALATALLLRDHPGSPADLKDQVASPGGTTIAALAVLEDAGVRGGYLRAVQRSAAKVRERRDAAASSVIE